MTLSLKGFTIHIKRNRFHQYRKPAPDHFGPGRNRFRSEAKQSFYCTYTKEQQKKKRKEKKTDHQKIAGEVLTDTGVEMG